MKSFRRIALFLSLGLLGLLLLVWLWPPKQTTLPAQDQRPVDVTFLVASDTHLGLNEDLDQRNRTMVARMNSIVGLPFPTELESEVGKPQALLLAGDLTENGEPQQWELFKQIYGSDGTDGSLHLPVFETCGNHDRAKDTFVLDRIRERHGGLNYTSEMGALHCISLGEAPDDSGLAFLQRALEACPRNQPIVLFFHLPLLGPWAENNWFGPYRERLGSLLQGQNIVAIFHGHSHFSGLYRWKGIDVYNPGSLKHHHRSFLVVRIRADRMIVACWNMDLGKWWWWHEKPLGRATSDVKARIGKVQSSDPRLQPNLPPQP